MKSKQEVVVITGGGSGIGQAAALAFAKQGAQVIITGRNEDKLNETRERASSLASHITAIQADISQANEMQRLFAEVKQRFGRLDVLFAHAGVNGVWAPLEDLAPEEWERTISVNLTGTFLTVKYALPLLKASRNPERKCAIVITSSINGVTKFSDVGSSAYSASKAAQIAFMKLLAVELAPVDIRVNAICPGSVATEIESHTEHRNTKANAEVADYKHGGIPLTRGKPASAEQVADLVLFLASPRAEHLTGSAIVIDAGQSLVQ